ncbi:MAG: hypothetical protein VZR06_07695 [Butyrivibrio sp.]|nr:hypothetical protein [Butyrivibrio sp.]
MYGIFVQCFVELKEYFGGHGVPVDDFKAMLMLVLFLAAAVFIIVSEHNLSKKALFGIWPVVMVVAFLFPVTKMIFVKVPGFDEGREYYRLLWLIPQYIVLAYAACLILNKIKRDAVKRATFVIMLLVIVFTGKYVYTEGVYMKKAENLYHIPQDVIDICELVAPEDEEERVTVAFPEELTWFVRQYDSNILMPYGADYIEEDYPDLVYYAYKNVDEINGVGVLNSDQLIEATRFAECVYVVVPEDTKTRKVSKDLETLGLKLVDKVGRFYVYKDPVVIKKIQEEEANG